MPSNSGCRDVVTTFTEMGRPYIRGRSIKFFLRAALVALVCCGCTTAGHPGGSRYDGASHRAPDDLVRLEGDLAQLLGYRDDEVPRLAQALLESSANLAREYRVQPPALWHNFLVNIGLRDKGLCCHWTQDLLGEIKALGLINYRALWGVSRHGTWREHSCVVVTAAGGRFETGLVMDPWRNAGNLFWTRVADDVYDWQPHPYDNGVNRIRCR